MRSVAEPTDRIAAAIRERGTRIVALDDDPTGSQTVSGVPVLLSAGEAELRWALEHPSPTAFVLTNTRAMPAAEAGALNEEIGERLARLAAERGADLRPISRSDSTLRGHFPAETRALERGLIAGGQPPFDGVLLCPAFLEAGRITRDDVQWVRDGDELVPAARTEFARDATFGYRSEDLPGWVAERCGAGVPVRSIGLNDLRDGGPERAAELLEAAPPGAVVVANATAYADLEALVLGLLAAEARGRRFLPRTGPSFVGVRGGIARRPPLTAAEVGAHAPGLVVVGSHTALTTRQLERAVVRHGLAVVELPVAEALGRGREAAVARVAERVLAALAAGPAALTTSRELVRGADGAQSLALSRAVSAALAAAVRRIHERTRLGWVLAKGGITSHDVAVDGLGATRAEVDGQLFEGLVSVWRLPRDGAPLPYVVFPGNVGGDGHLAAALDVLLDKET